MGCGTSKSDGVNPGVNGVVERMMSGGRRRGKENSAGVNSSLVGSRREAEQLADLPGAVPESESELMPKPISFEISAKDEVKVDDLESIIKKHPPRRLQKLEDQNSITHQKIQEKQMSARERRSQHLQERVQSSKLSRRAATSRSALPQPKLEPTIPE